MFFDILWLILGTMWFLYHYYSISTTAANTSESSTFSPKVNTTELATEDIAAAVIKLPFNQFQRIYLGNAHFISTETQQIE